MASEELKSLKQGNELEELSKEGENDDPFTEMYEEGSEKTKLIDLYVRFLILFKSKSSLLIFF